MGSFDDLLHHKMLSNIEESGDRRTRYQKRRISNRSDPNYVHFDTFIRVPPAIVNRAPRVGRINDRDFYPHEFWQLECTTQMDKEARSFVENPSLDLNGLPQNRI